VRTPAILFVAALLLAGAAACRARADDGATEPQGAGAGLLGPAVEAPLKIQAVPGGEWKFRTPRDGVPAKGSAYRGAWDDVSSGELPLRGPKGGPVRFQLRAPEIALDLDGDGEYELTSRQEIFTVQATTHDDGSSAPYTFRLRREGAAYFVMRACVAVGEIAKTPVALVDEDNDGRFDGIGKDAIRIGNAPTAQPLGRLVEVKGELYEVKPDQAGSKITYRKWSGPTGTIDLFSGFHGKCKPAYAIVFRDDLFFDAARKGGARVPAGDYELSYAIVGPSKDQFATVEKGRLATLGVRDGGALVLDWGVPGTIDFQVERQGNGVTVSNLEPYGRAGEIYKEWFPGSFKANCEIVEDGTGRRLFYGLVSGGLQRLATTRAYKVRVVNEMIPWLGPFASEWK
jgi:hypothetical protein